MDRNVERVIDFFPTLARLSTYFIFLLIPLVFFKNWMFPFVSSKLPFFYIFSALSFFFLAVNLIFRLEYRPSPRQLLPILPIFLLICSLGISGLLAPLRDIAFWSTLDRGDGWFFFFHLFLLIVTVFILILKDRSNTYKRNILITTLSSAGIVALTVWLGNEGYNLQNRIFSQSQGGGIFGNSSITATYLLFAAFLGLMVVFSRDIWSKRIRRFALAVTIIIIASPLFVNFSLWALAVPFKSVLTSPQVLLGSGRGVALGIILGVIVAGALRMIYSSKKVLKIVGMGIIAASIVGYIFFFVAIQKTGTTLQTVFKEQAGTNRLIFWDIAQGAVKERPVFGWGLDNFRVPFHRDFDPALLRIEENSEPWVDRAHNIFYDMAVTGGYIGLLLFLIVIGSLIWGVYYTGKKKLLGPWGAALLLGGMFAYLFQGLFVFDTIFSYLMLGLLYAFIFGLLQRETNYISTLESKINTDRLFYKIIVISIATVGVFASIIFIAIPLARTASLYGKIITTPLLERTLLWSRILENPALIRQGADLARLALHAETEYGKKRKEIFSPGNEAIRKTFLENFQITGSVLDKSALLQKEHNRGTVMYMTLNTAARIYNSSVLLLGRKDEKQLEKAEYYSRESVRESPMSPQVYWILAQTLVLQSKILEADEMLEKAITIDPYNKQSHRLSIQTAYSLGDKKAATRRLIRAKQFIPEFFLPFKIL